MTGFLVVVVVVVAVGRDKDWRHASIVGLVFEGCNLSWHPLMVTFCLNLNVPRKETIVCRTFHRTQPGPTINFQGRFVSY